MTSLEKSALQTAISLYLETGVLRGIMNCDQFLARVPASITIKRLKHLIEKHAEEIAAMAGAKSVRYESGGYKASGRGVFGRVSGGERAISVKPYIRFEF